MGNANRKLATQKRQDSHDISIVTVGLYWVKHIFGIYSAYIQHILEPEGNHEENKWTARKRGHTQVGVCHLSELCFGELVFAYTAKRTNPISGKIFERSARSDTVVRIANCGIVLVPANITNVLCHTNKN